MRSQADQLQTIGLIGAHEAAIAELYRAYAARFPQYATLFTALFEEEIAHARLLAEFVEKVRTGTVQIQSDRFTPQAIHASLDHIGERLKEARKGEVSALAALSTAVDLENGLIEKRSFEVVETDAPELQRILRTLLTDTTAHGERLRAAWETERKRPTDS